MRNCRLILKKISFSLMCLCMLSACGQTGTWNECVSPAVTATPVTPTPEQIERFFFADAGIEARARALIGREDGLLTDADVSQLKATTTLELRDSYDETPIGTLSDLAIYFPNLEQLNLSLYNRTMTREDWQTLGRLEQLCGLAVYAAEGFETVEPPERLTTLALSGDRDAVVLPETLLTVRGEDWPTPQQGELMAYTRLRADNYIFEWIETDHLVDYGEYGMGREHTLAIITEKDGISTHQFFALGETGMPDVDPERKLVYTDVDFDGKPDLLVCSGHWGSQGALHYDCFVRREKGFERCASFGEIRNPGVDTEHKQILSSWRIWAAAHGWGVYEYRDGGYVLTKTLVEEPAPDSPLDKENTIWQWTEEEGRETTAVWRSDEFTKEEIEDLIYNENSDWGIMTDRWRTLYSNGLMADFSIYDDG